MRVSALFDDPEVRQIIADEEDRAFQRINRLTNAQMKVLSSIINGSPNKIVAYQLGISQRTVENHRKVLMDKTGCKTFAELVRLSILAGIQH